MHLGLAFGGRKSHSPICQKPRDVWRLWGGKEAPAFDCATKTMIRDNAKDIAGQSRLQHSCRSGFPARALKVPK